jgi:hypothetical protein
VTEPVETKLTPLELLAQQREVTKQQAIVIAKQGEAINQLMTAVELIQGELRSLRRRLQQVEGVPWPDQEPPDPD